MHMQAPTLTTTRRPPLFVVIGALAIAAIVALVIAVATNDNSSTSSVAPGKPAVVQSGQDRVLDGSPLLRVRSAAPDNRVLDGSPLLRAGSPAPAVTVSPQAGINRVWDGTPALRTKSAAEPQSGGGPKRLPAVTSSLAGTTESQPQAQFPVRPPEGFHRQP
jgi:hypothetical protein